MAGSGRHGFIGTCLITGASHGLGAALACELAARGHRVLATARRAPTELPGEIAGFDYMQADLAQVDEVAALADWALAESGGRLDLALLNAGLGFYRPLQAETAADIARVLQVNLDACVHLAHALHPALSGGALGLVGSVAHKGAAGMPVYAASKGALDGFGRALAEEWRGEVRVRVLHPGPVATGMSERAGRPRGAIDRFFLSPRAVAAALLDALSAPRGADRQVISYLRVGRRGLWRGLVPGRR